MRDEPLKAMDSAIKVAILTQFYPPDYAATGQLIEELAKYLSRQGIHIQVLTGQPGYAYKAPKAPKSEQDENVKVRRLSTAHLWPHRIRGRMLNGLLFCLRAGCCLLRASYRGDVLLITSEPPYLPILGYFAHLLFGTPYICLTYDLYPDIAVKLHVFPARHWLVRLWNWLNRSIWQRANRIIVLNQSMRTCIIEKCPELKDRIGTIHNWANPQWIVPMDKHKNWFAQKFNLVSQFVVLYSGNLGRCHDMETILQTAEYLKDFPVRFVFIGNGIKQRLCQTRIKQLGLQNCQFLPYQDKAHLPYSLTACDLSLVTIAPGMEGLIAPSKLYAALASGRPIAAICEDTSYLSQLIDEAGCGAAFKNGDACGLAAFIKTLASDRILAREMGQAGRCYLKRNFTLAIAAEKYAQVLHQAVISRNAVVTARSPDVRKQNL